MMTTKKRPTWDEYFMELASIVKKRADCIRGKTAAIIVKDFRIISTGYNGTPHGIKNCSDGGCDRCSKRESGELQRYEKEESCICIHAEQNAIIQAAYLGISTKEGSMFLTLSPCSSCAKMIINSGIKKLIYQDSHHDSDGIKLLKEAGIQVIMNK